MYGYGASADGYSQFDRPLLSKHFQILGWLCKEIENARQLLLPSFFRSTLSSPTVLSRTAFETYVDGTISTNLEYMKVTIRYVVDGNIEIYRGNAIANAFNTDWVAQYGNAANDYLIQSVPRLL